MQAREIRKLTKEEIGVRLNDAQRELFNLRQDWYLGRLQDHNRLTAVKRDIARLKTIMREREMIEEIEGGAQ